MMVRTHSYGTMVSVKNEKSTIQKKLKALERMLVTSIAKCNGIENDYLR